ncbi:MAG: hypothetical protein WCV56_07465 [Candidatus Omnitrophota bacterium]
MYLNENAQVSSEARRILNNGYHRDHNFRHENLSEMVSIYQEIRSLPADDFRYCVEAVREIVDIEEKRGDPCYGKGLAYLKFLTNGILAKEYNDAAERYQEFTTSRRNRGRNYEEEVRAEMKKIGIDV